MSVNTLDCKVLIHVVHLRPSLWEPSDKNYQNRDLKLKLWEEVAAECDSFLQAKMLFFSFIDCSSVTSCFEGIVQM